MKFKNSPQAFAEHKESVTLRVTHWSVDAVCKTVGNAPFYDTEDYSLKKSAIKYCFKCPVQNQCLYTAIILNEQHGLWGGLSPKQRRLFTRNIRSMAIAKGFDLTYWTNKLSSFIYNHSHIQKVEKVLEY